MLYALAAAGTWILFRATGSDDPDDTANSTTPSDSSQGC